MMKLNLETALIGAAESNNIEVADISKKAALLSVADDFIGLGISGSLLNAIKETAKASQSTTDESQQEDYVDLSNSLRAVRASLPDISDVLRAPYAKIDLQKLAKAIKASALLMREANIHYKDIAASDKGKKRKSLHFLPKLAAAAADIKKVYASWVAIAHIRG